MSSSEASYVFLSGLAGDHQISNASLAYRLCQEFLKASPDFSALDQEHQNQKLLHGLELASWPGRCQVLHKGQVTWFFDGAHTVESLDLAGSWFSSASSSFVSLLLFPLKIPETERCPLDFQPTELKSAVLSSTAPLIVQAESFCRVCMKRPQRLTMSSSAPTSRSGLATAQVGVFFSLC